MKKLILSLALACVATVVMSQGQFKIRNDAYIQIGYTGYKALTFGQSTSTPNNGNFSIEHCSGCSPSGLNIWKPWPTSGSANFLMFIRDNGNIGIGNNGDATVKLNVSGSVRATQYLTGSDERFKSNIKPLNKVLDNINSIGTFSYNYKQYAKADSDSMSVNVTKVGQPYNYDEKLYFGFMAQDIQRLYPELVSEDENGFLSVNYMGFVPLLLKAIQEQNEKIKNLETIISTLNK